MTLMLVDAAGLYFRAFYGVPRTITTPDGRPINAVRGFLDMTTALLARRHPDRYVACLDLDWRPAFRVALVPSYKAHRVSADGSEDVPAALAAQVPLLIDVLDAIGLATAGADGFEADDVIATLAAHEPETVDVVTGDRDLLALATERVSICYTGRGVRKLEVLGPREIEQRYGVRPPRYPDFAVLRGDPSDGLPGVTGIGEKTAAALVRRFGDIEAIVAAAVAGADGFPAGARNKILAAREYLQRAPAVVRAATDVPLGDVDASLPTAARDPERLAALGETLGITSSLHRLRDALAGTR
jgi:5'-3' exonuclease